MSGKCSLKKSGQKYLQNLLRKPEGQRYVRCRHILKNNIKIYGRRKKEGQCENVNWIHLA
jgi:hypothetical protein